MDKPITFSKSYEFSHFIIEGSVKTSYGGWDNTAPLQKLDIYPEKVEAFEWVQRSDWNHGTPYDCGSIGITAVYTLVDGFSEDEPEYEYFGGLSDVSKDDVIKHLQQLLKD